VTLPDASHVLVRYADLSVKSGQVRGGMSERLAENVRAILADRGLSGTVERHWHRIVIETDEPVAVAAAAADAPGVASASPATVVPSALDEIVDAMVAVAEALHEPGDAIAVDAQRDSQLPFTSHELGRVGGAAVVDAVEDASVDLDDPDLPLRVEARPERTFVFTESYEGPGGLPVGTQAPVVALVSGGIDSPVAVHETLSRGAPVVPVYVAMGEYGGADHEARAVETIRVLQRVAPNVDMRPYRVEAGGIVADLVDAMEQGRMLSFRRASLRAAERIAEAHDAVGIATGEAIGQKSSQTTTNLAVTSAAVDLPVHRPLLTVDKGEIEVRAREIGTYDDSTIPAGCNRFAPDQAETHAELDWLRSVEPDDVLSRAAAAGEAAERLPL